MSYKTVRLVIAFVASCFVRLVSREILFGAEGMVIGQMRIG